MLVPSTWTAAVHRLLAVDPSEWKPVRWSVAVRYDGYRFGRLGWLPRQHQYFLTFETPGVPDVTDGIFAVDARRGRRAVAPTSSTTPEPVVAGYVLVVHGRVEQVFDVHGEPLDWVGWLQRPRRVPFYRDHGF